MSFAVTYLELNDVVICRAVKDKTSAQAQAQVDRVKAANKAKAAGGGGEDDDEDDADSASDGEEASYEKAPRLHGKVR